MILKPENTFKPKHYSKYLPHHLILLDSRELSEGLTNFIMFKTSIQIVNQKTT